MARTWLKQKRNQLGLSAVQVAKFANITPTYYWYIESGGRRPSVNVAQKIAEALNFSDEWYKLLEDTEIASNGAVS